MPFEKFTKTGSRGYFPKVSIWNKGQMGFNKGAVNRFNLNDFEYATLYYDKENKKIGIKFTNEEEKGVISIIKRKGGGVSLSAKAFLDFYEIEHSKTTKYTIKHDDLNDIYVLEEINDPT